MIVQKFIMWFAVVGLAATLPVLAVLWCRAHDFHPFAKPMALFRALPPYARVLISMLFCVVYVHGSTKGNSAGGGSGSGEGAESGEIGGTGGDSGLAGGGGGDGPSEGDGGDTGADSGVSGDSGETWLGEGACPAGKGGSGGRFLLRRDMSVASPLAVTLPRREGTAGTLAFTTPVSEGDDGTAGFTAEELARGYVLVRIVTDEEHDFAMPTGAEEVRVWRLRGASDDFVDVGGLRVFAGGRIVDTRDGDAWNYRPLEATLGIVPEANWGNLPEGVEASRTWIASADEKWSVCWENALFGRETNDVVCVRADSFEDGRVVYRYSGVSPAVASNSVVGVAHGGFGSVVALGTHTNVTSIVFHRLDPEDAENGDRDGDGLPTFDEIFVYGTDPGAADTDGDGEDDGSEIANGRDPLVRDLSDAEIRTRLAASSTNGLFCAEEVYEGELTATRLWGSFAFEIGGESEVVLYERTVDVDTRGGWQTYFLSSRTDSAGAWSLRGARVEWEDNAGGSGTVCASPRRDSLPLPVTVGATSLTIRIVGGPGEVRSTQPLNLLAYTPCFETDADAVVIVGDRKAYVFVDDGCGRLPQVGLDRSHRPCRAELTAAEPDVFPLPDGPGVYAFSPWERQGSSALRRAMALRSTPEPTGDLLLWLNPSVSYGTSHAWGFWPVVFEDGRYRRVSGFPFDGTDAAGNWWVNGGALSCGCEPSVSCAGSDRSYVNACIESYDSDEATGVVEVFGTEVWHGTAYHERYGMSWEEPENETPRCGCPSSCSRCDCNRTDGDSTGSVQFRVALDDGRPGETAGYVWFRSEGPVAIGTDTFTFSVRDGAWVTLSTSGGVRTAECAGEGGRDVTVEPVADGARIVVRPHGGDTDSASWRITNPDGDTNAVMIVRLASDGEVVSSRTYSCVTNALAGWDWTVTDGIAGTSVTVAHEDRLNADGRYRTVRNFYGADGAWQRSEETLEALTADGLGLKTVSKTVVDFTLFPGGKRIDRTAVTATNVTVTVETVTGPDVTTPRTVTTTKASDGTVTVRVASGGLLRECDGVTVPLWTEAAPAFTNEVLSTGRILSYDSWGRLVGVEDPDGDAVSLAYDGFDNLVSVTGPEGTVRAAYDAYGNRLSLDLSDWTGELAAPQGRARMLMRSSSAGGEVPVQQLTPGICLRHYEDGTGTPLAMSFSDIDTSGVDVLDFKAVRDLVSECHTAGSYPVNGHLAILTSGDCRFFLGHVTLKLTGTVTYSGGCGWTFSGTLTCCNDRFDFNKGNRTWCAEAVTAIGRALLTGVPYEIEIRGEKPLSGSGGCRGR